MKGRLRKSLLYLLCFLLIALSWTGVPMSVAQAESGMTRIELANTGFEEAVVDGNIPGWTQIMGTTEGGTISVDSAQSSEGGHSLKMVDNAAVNYAVESDKAAVEPGQSYRVTASAYIGVAVQLQLRFYDSAGKLISPIPVHDPNFQADPKGMWQTLSLDATAPEDAAEASVVLVTAKGGKGTSYWDDIRLYNVAQTEPEPEPEPSPEPSTEPEPSPEPSPEPEVPQYHIANAGFELQDTEGVIPNWTIKSGTPVVSNERAVVGDNSLKAHLVKDQGQAAINMESDLIDVEANKSYNFSAQVYLELGSIQGFYIYVYDKDGNLVKGEDGRDFHSYIAVTTPQEEWQYVEQALTVQPGGEKLKVSLITGARNSFTFYVDEVSVTEQITNGDMEEPVLDGIIPGWSKTKPADADSFAATDERQASGEYSLHIKNTPGEYVNVISGLVPVEAGATYTAAARTWIEQGSADMYVRFFDADGAYMGKQNWSIVAEPIDVWFDQYVTAVVPEGAQYAAILFAGSNNKNYSYYVDNVRLMRGAHEKPDTPLPDNSITLVGENLGPQIRKATLMRGAIGRDSDDRPVIYTVVAGAPAIFTIIDIETEQVVKSLPMPDTSGAWSVTMSGDGSVYLGAYNLGLLYRYIPSMDELVNLGHPLSTKDSVLYPMAAGKDGIMYGSTYPTAHLYAYDPAKGSFADYGTMSAQSSGERWTRVTVYDEETHKVYAGVGNVPRLLEYDLATGAKRDLLPAGYENIVSVYDLNIADGRLFARKEANNPNETFVIDIESGEQVEVTNADTGESSMTFINFSRGISPVSPVANKFYFAGSGGVLFEYDLDTNSYRSTGASIEGAAIAYAYEELNEAGFPGYSLVGLSGNSGKMFKYNLETGTVKLTDIQVPAEPVNIHEIVKGPDGKIYTAGYLQGNMGVYTPSSGESLYYEGIGQGEGMTVIHNKLYLGVYPGASIFEYDLSQPWNRTNADQLNPDRLFTLGDINQDRPFGLAGAEDLNKLFVGTVPKNGMLGGALAVYDIEAGGAPEVYPNLIPDQSILSLAYEDGLLYGGTSIHGGQGGSPTKSEAVLFIWDAVKKEKVFEVVPAAGKQAITSLHIGPDGNLWGLANGTLFVFDIAEREVVYSHNAFPRANGRWIDGSMETGTDGHIYATVGGSFFKVDADTKEITVLATGVRKLAQDDFGSFYMFTDPESPDLYKYTMEELLLKLTGVELSLSAERLKSGEQASVSLLAQLEKGRTTADLAGAEKIFASSNPSVAEVDARGVITAKRPGMTELSVQLTLDGVTVESEPAKLIVTGPIAPEGPGSGTPSSGSQVEMMEVKLESAQGILDGLALDVTRIKDVDGSITDRLRLDENLARQVVERLGEASNTVMIPLPDAKDEVGETTIVIDMSAAAILSSAGIELILSNGHARIAIPGESMSGRSEDITFRIVPLRKDAERSEIENRANQDTGVAVAAEHGEIQVLGRPVNIETNLQGRSVALTLPIDSDSFTSAGSHSLGVYIEHSDGSKELVHGELIRLDNGNKRGIQVNVDRFSTFAVVKVSGWQDEGNAAVPKYIHGYNDGSFRPGHTVTRAEAAAMIARIIEDTGSGSVASFRDVPGTHWAEPFIRQLVQLGVMRGYGDGSFKPDLAMTRAEFAMVLLPLLEENGSKLDAPSVSFSDMSGHWAEEAVTELQARGIVQGYDDGSYRPNHTLTRAEAVTMINRLLGIKPVYAEPSKWSDVPSSHWAYGDIQAVSE